MCSAIDKVKKFERYSIYSYSLRSANMSLLLFFVQIFAILFPSSYQDCAEEVFEKGISVTWPLSSSAKNITSNPLCYRYEQLVTRNCNGTDWDPTLDKLEPCLQVTTYFDPSKCPPKQRSFSNESDYCYHINSPSMWNYPCYKSGSVSALTDLDENGIVSLLATLNATKNKYFWLPAQRTKLFNPVVWYIPGPNWGRPVETRNDSALRMRTALSKSCLLLDVEQKTITTEWCTNIYPSLCVNIDDLRYPASCPDGYHAFRYMRDGGTCYGIEKSESDLGSTYDEFLQSKCLNPMGGDEVMRFIFSRVSELDNVKHGMWCWFQIVATINEKNIYLDDGRNDSNLVTSEVTVKSFQGVINGSGTLGLKPKSSLLPCMACEVKMVFKQTEFLFDYDNVVNKMYLTIYYPSGLWKYDGNDKGVQCFTNAKGFTNVVNVNDVPVLEVKIGKVIIANTHSNDPDKVVYEIDPVTYTAAQYWCEGHTTYFSILSTNKLTVSPNYNEEHVFAIVTGKKNFAGDEDEPDMTNVISNATKIFGANKVLLMDILEIITDCMLILLHLHVSIKNSFADKAKNIEETFLNLKHTAQTDLPKHNYTFVNISSSIYCLPEVSNDEFLLNWEMTPIGHIATPRQFCLQENGLPVKRHCYGSYLLGSFWGDIEGTCNNNFIPSSQTKFLYDFVKGNIPDNDTTRFLTDGLEFVLDSVEAIIPADIYYLSMSLQHVLYRAENNQSVDMGDIDNMAWVMDRVMSLDQSYLRLSQTMNSTNVILDSVNDIIEYLIEKQTSDQSLKHCFYLLAVKPQFLVQISYPEYNNITGLAIIRNEKANKFTDMDIKPLFKNTTLTDVMTIQNLEVAAWLPGQILDSIQKASDKANSTTNQELHIVISVFHNDAVFQELDFKPQHVNSRVIGISIPGYASNLKYAVPLVFKDFNINNTNKFCGYWNFLTENLRDVPGSWAKKGCFLIESQNGITVCECYHLTHFGQLLNTDGNSGNNKQEIEKHHKRALNIITLVGSFLSLVGIVGIWITASVFSSWRNKAGTKVLLHLATSIALPLIFIVVFNVNNKIFIEYEGVYSVAEHMSVTCIILGMLLHYSILASFMWMLITAVLQFVRYVRVLGACRPSRFMMKCTVVGWGSPLIPVTVILLLDKDNYIPTPSSTDFGRGLICYPKGLFLLLSVILPICLILTVNIILFLIVMYSIYRGPDGKMRSSDIDLIGAQFRLSIFLFFLLGLSWIFGILSFTNNLLWSYLFCLTSTIQGFVLFVYFVLCDPSTRSLWISLMTPNFRDTTKRESVTSISSG